MAVANVVAKGTKAGFNDAETELPFASKMDDTAKAMGGTPKTYTVTFTYNDNGEITNVSAQ